MGLAGLHRKSDLGISFSWGRIYSMEMGSEEAFYLCSAAQTQQLHIPCFCKERGCTATAGGADIPGVTVELGEIPVSLISLCDSRWRPALLCFVGLPVLMHMAKVDVYEYLK